MTDQEVRALIALAMSYDNRKFPGDSNIAAWTEQAERNEWTFEAAREAIHEHYATSTEFLMPAHITAILTAVRRRIRAQFSEDVNPPRHLRDDPVAEIAWRRKFAEEYTRRALDAWVKDREIPALEQPPDPQERERPQLDAAVRSLATLKVVPREPRPARRVPDRTEERAARIAKARAELDAIDPDEVQAKAAESMRRSQRDAS